MSPMRCSASLKWRGSLAVSLDSNKLVRHDIAVTNILYGGAHFITLRLPETWDIAPGVGRPEIVATHMRHERRWIVSGKAWYVLYHRELGWAMELMLESRPVQRSLSLEGVENLAVHGHVAAVRRWQRKRGVIHPKTITFVEFTFNCEETERWLRLELSGRCPPEGFQEMLPLVSGWWCH